MVQRLTEMRRGDRQIPAGLRNVGWNRPRYRPRILRVAAGGSGPADLWRPPQEPPLHGPARPARYSPQHSRRWQDIEGECRPAEDWKNRWPVSGLHGGSCQGVPLAFASPQWFGGDSLAR